MHEEITLKLQGTFSIKPAAHQQHPSGAPVIAQVTAFDGFR